MTSKEPAAGAAADEPSGDRSAEDAEVDEAGGSPESSDWLRYGLGRQATPKAPAPANKPFARRAVESHDDLYLEYRRENVLRGRVAGGRSARSRANLLAIASVGIAAVVIVAAAYATASPGPTPVPTIQPTTAPTPALVTEPPTAGTKVQTAYVTTVINIGQDVDVPDRAYPPDDGTAMYLFGSGGGVAIVTSIGSTGTQFKGVPFAAGLPVRAIVANGTVWVSTSPSTGGPCEEACWDQSTTYQLNVGSGKVEKTLAKTYLVGLTSEGLWLASAGRIEKVDPSGKTIGGFDWLVGGEPRVGCDGLWSVDYGGGQTVLSELDAADGTNITTSSVSGDVPYGPVSAGTGCWMLQGAGGFVAGSSVLVPVTGGAMSGPIVAGQTLLLLDGNFWAYSQTGRLEEYDALLGDYVGPEYELAGFGTDDPSGLFASMGSVWLIDKTASQLIGFAVPTGAEGSASPAASPAAS